MTVAVRDTGGVGGVEPVQVYGTFPTSLGEPGEVLVGFGTVAFSRADARAGVVKHATIPLLADALTTYSSGSMRIVKGAYCFAASTFEGDPHSVATGSVVLSPGAASNSVTISRGAPLSSGSCPI